VKYVRLNWVIDADEKERAMEALGLATAEFAAQHNRWPVFYADSKLVFSGIEPPTRNRVYDYMSLGDKAFIAFLENHASEYRPLQILDARQVVRLPALPDRDKVFLN
jgi:hypothetical protein